MNLHLHLPFQKDLLSLFSPIHLPCRLTFFFKANYISICVLKNLNGFIVPSGYSLSFKHEPASVSLSRLATSQCSLMSHILAIRITCHTNSHLHVPLVLLSLLFPFHPLVNNAFKTFNLGLLWPPLEFFTCAVYLVSILSPILDLFSYISSTTL